MLQPAPTEPNGEPDGVQGRTQPLAVSPGPAVALDPAWRAGRKLTEARLQRGWTLDEVAERIRVRREFLDALEDMNIKLLPGKAYALAFLRSYARELGIDERAIVDQFQEECALSREDVQKPIRSPSSRPHPERPWLAAAALVAVAAVFVGWRALNPGGATEPAPEAAVVEPSLTVPTETVAGERRVVEIRAVSDAWLEARGPDGTVFLSQTLHAGEVYRPDPSPGWTLHARDGGAFELFVDGAPAGPLGAPGMPVLGRQIDEIVPLTQASAASPRS